MNDSTAIRRFEDLKAWQLGRELVKSVYILTQRQPFKNDYGLVDQIRRAAVSVMNNVAEGFERGSNKDFAKFLFIARGSAGEVRSLLYVARDLQYIDKKNFDVTYDTSIQAPRVIWGLIKNLKAKNDWVIGQK